MSDGGNEWDSSRPQDGAVDKSVVKEALRELQGLPGLRGRLTRTAGQSGDSVRRPTGDDQGNGGSSEGGDRSMGARHRYLVSPQGVRGTW